MKLWVMDLDNIKALCEGGNLYASNDDYANAIRCWSLAAEDKADHEGKYRLGICYYEGKGVEQDMFSAISWLNNASLSGSFKAAKILGGYYENLAYSIVEREVSVTDNQLAIWQIPRIEKTKILTYPEYLNNAIEYYSQYLINIDAYVHWDNRQEIGFDLEKKARKIIDSDIADELKIEKLKRLMRLMRGVKMLDRKQSFILQSRRKLARLLTKIKAVWREHTTEEQPTEVCEKPYRSTDPTTKVATQLKWMLLKIYRPQVAFELRVTEQRPKSRMGYYVPAKRSITIHGGWGDVHSLEEIAIHEYAHHIHFTEHRRSGKKDAPHGQNFWRIYSALMAKAIEKRLYNDKYIDKIIEQEDE